MRFRVPSVLSQDYPRKLAALFFAVLIWVAVQRQLHDFETFHGVPVILKYDSNVLWVDETQPVRVDITLRGSRKRLQSTASPDLKVVVAAKPVPRGWYFEDLRILPESIRSPLGTRVSEVTPNKITLAVDSIVEKAAVPVIAKFEGTPREGYSVGQQTLSHPTVDLRGPSKILDGIREVETAKVSLEGAIQDFQVDDVRLERISPHVKAHPDRVTVKVAIVKVSAEQVYSGLDVHVLARTGARLRVQGALPKVSVTLRGPRATLDALDNQSIRPFVDILSISNPGEYRRAVRVWIDGAAGVIPEYVSPSVLDVIVTESDRPAGTVLPIEPAPPGGP